MVLDPLPDWMQKALLVGTYEGKPILVRVDEWGQLTGGLNAYIDRYSVSPSGVGTGGEVAGVSGVVPEGEVWIITNISAYHEDTTPRQVRVYFRYDTTDILLFGNSYLLKDEVLSRQGMWVLKEGDFIRIVFTDVGIDDALHFSITGYKVEVAV